MSQETQNQIVLPYLRVSSDKQTNNYSLESQADIAQNYINLNNYNSLEAIVETGSGESISNRSGILKALNLAEKNLYDILFVVETSRIARKMSDAVRIIDLFRAQGVKVATPSKVFDFSDYNDTFISHVTASIDELERQKIRERSARGRRKSKSLGANYLGEFLPYGFTTKKVYLENEKRTVSKIVFDDVEKKGLKKIINLAEDGLSTREIAKEMTALKYKTKMGNDVWNKASINQMLKSTWLYGVANFFTKQNYMQDGKRITTPLPKNQWITQEVPAIITKEKYDKLQKIIAKRTLNSKRQTKFQYLFADLLTCGNCKKESEIRGESYRSARIGHRTDWYNHTSKNGERVSEPRYAYYVCVGRNKGMRDWDCTLPQIRANILDDFLWNKTKELIRNPKIIYNAVICSQEETIEKRAELESKINDNYSEINTLNEKRKKVVSNYLMSDFISESDYKTTLGLLDSQIKELKIENESLKNMDLSDPKEMISFNSLEDACSQFSKSLDQYDFRMKQKLVNTLYEDVVIDLDWQVHLYGKMSLNDEENSDAYFQIDTQIPAKTKYNWTNLYTATEVAKKLGISVKTLKNREKRGIYPTPIKYHSYYKYYSSEEVEKLKQIAIEDRRSIKY